MKKNFLITWLGFALTAGLLLAGCGGSDDGVVLAPGGGGVSGGGGNGGGGGTFGFDTTGGPGGFGGTGGRPVGNTGTAGGTGTTGGDGGDGGGGDGDFLGPVNPTQVVSSLNNPTFFNLANVNGGDNTQAFVVTGFGQGPNQGRLATLTSNGQLVELTARSGQATLSSPFGLASDGSSLYVSTGFNLGLGQGAIVRVSNITVTDTAATADFDVIATGGNMINPAYMTFAGNAIFWTQYAAANSGGGIYRVRTDGAGGVVPVVTGLNFPVGLDNDGSRLVVAEASGAGGIGRVAMLNNLNLTDVDGATGLTTITTGGDPAFLRPFDVTYDFNNGFFISDGGAIQMPGTTTPAEFPDPSNPGLGTLRYLDSGSTVAQIVSDGLNQTADVDAVDFDGDGVTSVLFSESASAFQGRILRRLVDTRNVANVTPTPADSGRNNPLGVFIIDENSTTFVSVVDYRSGQNGLIVAY